MRLIYCLITIFFILLSSCTIQKRSFRNGYSISWNNSFKKLKSEEKHESTEDKQVVSEYPKDTLEIRPVMDEKEFKILAESQTDSISDFVQTIATKNQTEKALYRRLEQTIQAYKQMKDEGDQEEEIPKKRINLFALNGFVFAVGYIILLFYAHDQSNDTWIPALAIISLLFAIGLTIVGLRMWKHNKNKFWGNFFSILALIVLSLGTLIFFVYAMSNTSFG